MSQEDVSFENFPGICLCNLLVDNAGPLGLWFGFSTKPCNAKGCWRLQFLTRVFCLIFPIACM